MVLFDRKGLVQQETSASVVEGWVTTDENVIGPERSIGQDSCQVPQHSQREDQPNINDKYFLSYADQIDFFLEQESKYVGEEIPSSNVKGKLKEHIAFWKMINANPDIIDVIQNGYKIPFVSTPPEMALKNNKSALCNMDFVLQTVEEMLVSNYIVETPFKPHVINPLSVAINSSGKKRLILDLRLVNKHIWKEKLTFEDWKTAIQFFDEGSFMFKFDLSKGYYHIDMHKSSKSFLGFSVKGRNFCYNVCPFGLSSAPFIFTKLLRELVKYWRYNSINIVMFLDDGFGLNENMNLAVKDALFVKQSLTSAGFVINDEKSVWVPCQILEWVGLIWNSKTFSISIPNRRINDLFEKINHLLGQLTQTSARKLAVCSGKVISMMPVVGNIARLMTRYLYLEIEKRIDWDFHYTLHPDNACIVELKFWLDNIEHLNIRYLKHYQPTQTIIYSDASNIACSAFVVKSNENAFHDNWSVEDSRKSSTFRELKAVFLALRAYGKVIANRTVKWFSDSQSCVHIVKVGSPNKELQDLAIGVFNLCILYKIDLDIQWVPRNLNQIADNISKIEDTDCWEVSDEFFAFIDSIWGPHDIDRFATATNRKLFRYNSKFYDFETEAVDCFTQNWKETNNWLVPPITMVIRTVKHILACDGHGTLIVPKWPSSAFWSFLFEKNYQKREFIKEVLEFSPDQNIFVLREGGKCIFESRRFSSKILAIRL